MWDKLNPPATFRLHLAKFYKTQTSRNCFLNAAARDS